MDGELGEGRAATNLTTAILGSRRGGKHRGGAPGLFRSCGSVRGLVTRRRSSGAARGIVGTAVVAATANGGGGRVRWSVRERDRGGERGRGRERGGPGSRGGAGEKTRGVAVARRRRQAAWWRGARARAVGCPSSAYWQRLGMTGTRPGGLAGSWAVEVRPRWAWWAPGKCPGESLSLSYFSFSISVILFWFSLETKPF